MWESYRNKMTDNRPLANIDYRKFPSYPIIGDIDKSFHRPECLCVECEKWRVENNRIIGPKETRE